jgi:glucokinase
MKEQEQMPVVMGIDLGATNLKAVIIDNKGRVYRKYTEPSKSNLGPGPTLNRIKNLIEKAAADSHSDNLQLRGIGIGACGPVNSVKGEIIESPVLPGWHHVPVVEFIEKSTAVPVCIDNDANMAILGEWWLGGGHRKGVVAGLTLGTGIGGGLIMNGKVYRGAFGYGAEFGHIRVADAPPCLCGNKGCLGRVASASATLERYRQLAGEEGPPIENIIDLKKLYETGVPAAREAISFSVKYLCQAALILINCLNPQVFIFTGGMALLGDILLSPVRKFVYSSTFKTTAHNTKIEIGKLGMFSGAYGAAYLALSG